MSTAQQAREFFTGLQQRIVEGMEKVDGKHFRRDEWERPEGGGGLSCVLEEGNVLERGGVNYSHVFGGGLPASATAARPELAGRSFEAMGVSLVLHPRNPYAPTVHLNVRYLEARKEGAKPVWWFGGGMDLTPYYGFEEDAVHFHQTCKNALQPFGDTHPRTAGMPSRIPGSAHAGALRTPCRRPRRCLRTAHRPASRSHSRAPCMRQRADRWPHSPCPAECTEPCL